MLTSATLRLATATDCAFLIEAIEAAESFGSPDQRTTYEHLFSLSRSELEEMLQSILVQDTTGHQLARQNFFLLDGDSGPVAACAAWVEAEDGVSSGFKVAALLGGVLGTKRWIAAKEKIRALAKATPQRTPGTMQMETFYVDAAHRGQGITARLIAAIRNQFKENGVIAPAEITMLGENGNALKAYQRAGFHLFRECPSDDPIFNELMTSRGFIQLRASLGD